MPPDRGLSNKQQSGVKGQKTRLTYVFTANADGSEKLKPLVIGKAFKPRAFNNKTGGQLGFSYRNNAKAWMTSEIYQGWLREWDRDLQLKNPTRNILLLQDNFSGHIVPEGLQRIRVENFKANLTAHVQPNDAGIIRCFKAHYCRFYFSRAIDHYDQGITPSDVYKINQLEAMRLADAAWREVDMTTIRNCWHKAGILPDASGILTINQAISSRISIPISTLIDSPIANFNPILLAEEAVNKTLDKLQETGVLQEANRMSIEQLLNPVEEHSHTVEDISDEDI